MKDDGAGTTWAAPRPVVAVVHAKQKTRRGTCIAASADDLNAYDRNIAHYGVEDLALAPGEEANVHHM